LKGLLSNDGASGGGISDVGISFFIDIFNCTNGGAGSGFGVYHSDGLKSNIRLRKPGGVFSSKMLVTFVVLIQIKARNPGMMGMKFTCCIIIFLV
jgi:hypothetical protein